jgi:acetoacetyl-CoA synthetase
MAAYMGRLRGQGRSFSTYDELWRWSVTDLEGFWQSAWEHLGVRASAPPTCVLASRRMPRTDWFPGARLNYAEHALRREGEELALIARDESGGETSWSRDRLRGEVARIASALRGLGVGPGDRVAAFLPNVPEAVAAFLATASLGAVWSSCSPDFGAPSVLDRFRQIEPRVLFAVASSRYGDKTHDRRAELARIREGLPSLRATVLVGERAGSGSVDGALAWDDLPGDRDASLAFEQVPFSHPLWILYSSGTTGLPKPIVQGHGGILLEHLKALSLHSDLGEGDRFFWFTTTGWMMWNFLVSGLLVGSTIVLWDGSPMHPDPLALWRMAEETGTTCFGTSAPYLLACLKQGVSPKAELPLRALRSVGSTGAPLPPEGFAWVYEHVKDDVLLASISGGTDACTAFVLSCPLLPVHAGEIQCRGLGAKVEAFDEAGRSVVGRVGELVLTEPLPSMPLFFWNDPGDARLHESYFAAYPGAWRHGDWIEITERGSCVITGRSDSTLNRAGVRMGTSEFYRVVEAIPEIADSLVVDTGSLGHEDKLWLFVVVRDGGALTDELRATLRAEIRAKLSPRHVPDEIRAVPAIPRTINGKKLEIPVKRILLGEPLERAANPGTLSDPASLEAFIGMRGD